jgi:NAD(P)-dependent dehydrogenase (short-subunit alcohol dehydrogenase family)
VTKVAEVDATVKAIVSRYGRLDTLVNNAAIFTGWHSIDDSDLQLASRVLETNVLGYFISSRAALPHLRVVRGTIVNIGSLGGEIGLWHDAIYAASKSAVLGLTRSLAMDEAKLGVRVNAILPGNILVERRLSDERKSPAGKELHNFLEGLSWLGRSGTTEEVGKAALFLASEMGSYCTGVGLILSGGVELGMGAKHPYPDFGTAP